MRTGYGTLVSLSDFGVIFAGASISSGFVPDAELPPARHAAVIVFIMGSALFTLHLARTYEFARASSPIAFALRAPAAWIAMQAAYLGVTHLIWNVSSPFGIWLVSWTALTACGLFVLHLGIRAALDHGQLAPQAGDKVAVLGYGARYRQLISDLSRACAPGAESPSTFEMHPSNLALGTEMRKVTALHECARHVRNAGVREIWVVLPLDHLDAVSGVIEEFRNDLVDIRLMPDVSGVAVFHGGLVELQGSPAIDLTTTPLSLADLWAKALFDRMFAAAALVTLAPLMLAIAVAVKLSSPGAVFFRQKRKTLGGRVFGIYKFRTMRVHRDQPGIVTQATRDDPRMTPIGRFLRRTSLDELPQFLNVLRGDMSVVGPRPHAIEHDEVYSQSVHDYMQRYRIKPGITGWAQVNGLRGETEHIDKMRRRVEHDLFYIRNWSFAMDLRIIAATIANGFKHANAY
ncbi:MAG TPA: undecaprenyl-phosphate glucose phosphotransferase [Trinickia sp.]|nr:undecaprenyl-phosphate glucose phosphotransferase [Trinickia sp.]